MTRTLLDLEISPATLAGWGACWSPRQIAEYLAAIGAPTTTLGAALADDRISPADRVWLGCAALARADRSRLAAFARGCADSEAVARAAWARATWAAYWADAARASDWAGAAADAADRTAAWAAAVAGTVARAEEWGRQLAHLAVLAAEVAS